MRKHSKLCVPDFKLLDTTDWNFIYANLKCLIFTCIFSLFQRSFGHILEYYFCLTGMELRFIRDVRKGNGLLPE